MKMIDLTHEIIEGMPVYPGTEPPKIEIATTIEKDGFEERLLTMFSHTGTHMDAPCHILKGRKSLSDFDISDFCGRAVLVDVRGMDVISADAVRAHADMLAGAHFAVLFSGWDRCWGSDKYFADFPVLSAEAAEYLTGLGLRGVAMDMISIDPADTQTYDNHKIVFAKDMLVVENLKGLERISAPEFELTCLPLNISRGDGSPVRAVARF